MVLNNAMTVNFISHPLLKEGVIESRIYQQKIVDKAIRNNIVVMLPDGTGKTTIAVLLITYYLKKYQKGNGSIDTKCIFLTPTKPLVLKRIEILQETLTISKDITFVIGSIANERRKRLFHQAKVLVMTPQVLMSDLESGLYDLSNVSLVVFDECHRATGNYAYVRVAKWYQQHYVEGRVLGLTTSLGAKHIASEVCENLRIDSIESKIERYLDERTYQHPRKAEWRKIPLPRLFQDMRNILEESLYAFIEGLKKRKVVQTDDPRTIRIKQLVGIQNEYQDKLKIAKRRYNRRIINRYKVIIAHIASCTRLLHLIERIETQGLSAAKEFISRIKEKASESKHKIMLRRFINLSSIKKVEKLIDRGLTVGYEHPKIIETIEIVKKQLTLNPDSRILVFTNYQDSGKLLANRIKQSGMKASVLVGGRTANQRIKLLKKFEQGIFNTLVATSAAEQGLDIIDCDLVVFYDCVPDLIRVHQRSNKTGKKRRGKIIVLVTKGTKDERYYWVAREKEKKMMEDITFWT